MKGKNGVTNVWLVLIVLGILSLSGAVVYGVYQSQTATENIIKSGTSGGCELNPTITLNGIDSINPGTALTTTMVGRKNGAYAGTITAGTTVFSKGDKVELLASATNYATKKLPEITIDCGVNTVKAELVKLDGSPTVKVFNDAGNVMTDTTGCSSCTNASVNQSSSSNAIAVDMTLTVPSDEGIGGLVFVIEATNSTEIREMTLSSNDVTVSKWENNKPDLHTYESSLGLQLVRSFEVTDIPDDGAKSKFTILFEPQTGKTMGGMNEGNAIYVTWYIEQDYADTDGTFKTGIENADGTAKHVSAASSDYDFVIGKSSG